MAATPIAMIRIERAPFRNLLKDEPDIALKIQEGIATWMRSLIESL